MKATVSKSETLSVKTPFPLTHSLKGRKDVFNITMAPGCKVYKIDDPDKKNDLWINGDSIDAVS
jgi:hypothetical protein